MKRKTSVDFADRKVKEALEQMKDTDPDMHRFVNRALDDLKRSPLCGIHVPRRLIPKIYIQKYGISNLWKYNLPGAWRLLYSLTGDEVEIVAIVLEWLPHKEYERRFGY